MDQVGLVQKWGSSSEKLFFPPLSTKFVKINFKINLYLLTFSVLIVNTEVPRVVTMFMHFNSQFAHLCLASSAFCSANKARIQFLHCCCKTAGNLADILNGGGSSSSLSDCLLLLVEIEKHWIPKNFIFFRILI